MIQTQYLTIKSGEEYFKSIKGEGDITAETVI